MAASFAIAAVTTGAAGVTAMTEGSEVPTALLAVTETEYVVPFVRPLIVQDVAVVVVQLLPPGDAVEL